MTSLAERPGRLTPPLVDIRVRNIGHINASSFATDTLTRVPVDLLVCGHAAVNHDKQTEAAKPRRCLVCGGGTGARVAFMWRHRSYRAPLGAFKEWRSK